MIGVKESSYYLYETDLQPGYPDPGLIAQYATEHKMKAAFVRVAWNQWSYKKAAAKIVIPALKSAGVKVYAWQYITGANPAAEASHLASLANELNISAGVVADAEAEYKKLGPIDGTAAARIYFSTLRSKTNLDILFTSYRYPDLHHKFPWKEFMSRCDGYMPQVYWIGAHNPADQIRKTLHQYRERERTYGLPTKDIWMIGAAFKEYGWTPTNQDLIEFIREIENNSDRFLVKGAAWWEWRRARNLNFTSVIANYDWQTEPSLPTMYEVISNAPLYLQDNTLLGFLDEGTNFKGELINDNLINIADSDIYIPTNYCQEN